MHKSNHKHCTLHGIKQPMLTMNLFSCETNKSYLFTLLTNLENRYAVLLLTWHDLFHKPRSSRKAICPNTSR